MKTATTYILVTFAALMICGTVVADEPKHICFSKSDFGLTKEQGKTRIVTGVNVGMGQPGYPELPAISYRYVIPFGRQVVAIRVLNVTKSRLPGEHVPLRPAGG